MAGIGTGPIFPQPRDKQESDLFKAIQDFANRVVVILNRGIKFEDNVDCRLIEFTSSGTPDAENTVAHSLGKVPTGYIVYSVDKAGVVYKGSTTWTTTNIYLKVNVASVAVKIIVF